MTSPPLRDPWQVIAYEVRMYDAAHDIVLDPESVATLPRVLQNAVEESAVLHTRILCEVFLSKYGGPDDIRLSGLFPGLHADARFHKLQQAMRALRKRYGSSSVPGFPCWVFNKMMAHPTAKRGMSYDYTGILRNLQPVVREIIAEIQALRGVPFTWSW